ncbi:MAG: hypothetical protein AUG74_08990 [Bacteroidetes bacterium 13_1_20CM_4_60_6]|nr:MAG: hypothetical protein AUG74_08990 [Bacteroidetes bacterium 13_1_20CM_4_60_6]
MITRWILYQPFPFFSFYRSGNADTSVLLQILMNKKIIIDQGFRPGENFCIDLLQNNGTPFRGSLISIMNDAISQWFDAGIF